MAEAEESLAAVATPTEMRDFIEQYVGPMELTERADAIRWNLEHDTAPAEVGAVVKRSIAGARSLPLHTMREAFWEKFRSAA